MASQQCLSCKPKFLFIKQFNLKVICPGTNHKIIPRYNYFSMAFGIFSRIFPPLWSQELLKKALSHRIRFRGNNACLHYESVPITWSY